MKISEIDWPESEEIRLKKAILTALVEFKIPESKQLKVAEKAVDLILERDNANGA